MLRIGMLALAALLVADGAKAQDNYPSQTVKIVIPSAPGSTTDILARLTADQLGRKWGKPVIVENIAGGSMNTGAAIVARAAPDGYTLFLAPPAPIALSHLLSKNLSYNPLDWVPITLLAKIANVLSVRNGLPAHTLQELIAYGKAHPGKLTFATQGPTSTAHLSAAQLEVLAGIKMLAVPYRGAQPALTDIIAGNVDMFFDTLATSVPLHRGGKLEDFRGRRSPARQDGAGAADLLGGGSAGLPIDHLVRAGGAARHAGGADAADQSRRGRDAAEPRGRRPAAKPVARSRRNQPGGDGKVLRR